MTTKGNQTPQKANIMTEAENEKLLSALYDASRILQPIFPECGALFLYRAICAAIDREKEQQQPQQKYFTIAEIAELLGTNPETVSRARRAGKLKAVDIGNGGRRVWRVTRAALKEYIGI